MKKTNLLTDAQKKEAQEATPQTKQQEADIRLVVPEVKNGQAGQEKKKESWFAKRRRKKAMKRAQKLRRKGETGSADIDVKKDAASAMPAPKVKPDLFEDVKAKPAAMPKKKVMAKPKKQPKPQVIAEPKPAAKPKAIVRPLKPVKKVKEQPKVIPKKAKQDDKKKPEVKKTVQPKNEQKAAPAAGMHNPESDENFDGPTVNLVPDTLRPQQGTSNWMLVGVILLLTVAVWVIVGGVAVSRVKGAEAQVATKQAQLDQINKAIGEYSATKSTAQLLQKQFSAVSDVVDGHLSYESLLTELEALTIPDVYYVSLNVDTATNMLTVQAVAKNYAAAARQIRSFESAPDFAQNVTVSEARVENQPDVQLPIPIVRLEIQVLLAEGILLSTTDVSE